MDKFVTYTDLICFTLSMILIAGALYRSENIFIKARHRDVRDILAPNIRRYERGIRKRIISEFIICGGLLYIALNRKDAGFSFLSDRARTTWLIIGLAKLYISYIEWRFSSPENEELNKYNMKQLLSKVGNFFKGLFNAAARTFNKLPEEIKAASVWASGVVNVINQAVANTPPDIKAAIFKAFPQVTEEQLKNFLLAASKYLNLGANLDQKSTEELLGLIKSFLDRQEGAFWAVASRAMATLGTVIFSPLPVKVEAIGSLIGYVYHEFIKKD